MRRPLILFFAASFFAPLARADPPKKPALVISVTNVKKSKGLVRVAVYRDNDKQWLEDKHAISTQSVPARAGTTLVRVTGLAPGRYGVAVFHDEDSDGKLDTNLVGIPTEAYGFSRNPGSKFGPPKLKDARFIYHRGGRKISIKVNTWL